MKAYSFVRVIILLANYKSIFITVTYYIALNSSSWVMLQVQKMLLLEPKTSPVIIA